MAHIPALKVFSSLMEALKDDLEEGDSRDDIDIEVKYTPNIPGDSKPYWIIKIQRFINEN
jgi:hypothetical protein